MIKKAFLQEYGNKSLGHEEKLVMTELEKRHIPFSFFSSKKISRRQLPLDLQSFLVGDIDSVEGALKQLKISIPAENTYPLSLQHLLFRKTWKTTLARLENSLLEDASISLFAKPASRRKRFTGRVFQTHDDLQYFARVSRKEEIFCSEVVSWLSEYRVYVVHSEIRSIDHYDGDKEIPIDKKIIDQAISILANSPNSRAGYAIDFGVLSTGETALIELNDGYSIGAYNIDAKNYTDLLMARWEQLLNSQ